MSALKKILVVLSIMIAIPLIAALFVPKDYAIEREIVINRPKSVVFDYIRYLKNQDNFSVWNQKDSLMKKEYKGTDGTVGFVAAWESENDEVGKGEQEIMNIVEGERIDTKLRFKIPFEAQDDAYFATESLDSNTTKIKWGFKGSMPYPFNIMGLFFDMDKEVGGDLGQGLANLKTLMERK